jgi:homopolymeric O-antigen transport system ATP-binding protein
MSIQISNLSKKYPLHKKSHRTLAETLANLPKKIFSRSKAEEFWALCAINLEIAAGEQVGIIGSNGAGKSTLLKIISKITNPTSGQIKVQGRVASLLEVGTGFHLELTGRENIFLNGALLGLKRREIRSRFDEIVAFAEVEPFLDMPVKRYSSGMLARLGFAVAAHLDPDILIVDEVLAVGDRAFQEKCLKNLSKQGCTVLFVSHNIHATLALCKKGILLEKGRIKQTGPIESCLNAYLNAPIGRKWQGCLGDEHMRILNAALESDFFYNHETIPLAIELEIEKPHSDLFVEIAILKNHQVLGNARRYISEKGRHTLTFPLNLSLFHEGEYYLQVGSGIHNVKRIVTGEITLALPIFSQTQNPRFVPKDGIFLGDHWHDRHTARHI